MSIKSIAIELLRSRRRAHWAAPKKRIALTSTERKEVEAVWGGVWSKPNYEWHEHYKAVNGEFDPRYMPGDVFYLDLLPRLSDLALSEAWEDKSYYAKRFQEFPFPALRFACIGGRLVDKDLSFISWENAYQAVRDMTAAFVKPSLGSYQGIGAFRLELTDINSPEDLKTRLADCGGNFVVQELIEQADLLSSFNPSSVNIIRMNTVCLNGDAFLANATIRFGVAGSVTDMAHVEGVEIARVAGLSGDGCLRGFFCNQDGDRAPLSELGIQGEDRVPGYYKAVNCCKELHKQMHHFGLVAFDVAIRSNGEPVIVEMNIDGPGSVFYQYANGPFFGDRTEDVIEWCKKRTWNPALNMQIV